MSDKDFGAFIQRLKDKKEWLVLTVPNAGQNNLSLERTFALAEKNYNYDFFHQLWFPEEGSLPKFLTPERYLLCKLPVRVASQRIAKKASIPRHQRVINSLTGQPTGDSKGAGFSSPELRLTLGMGLDKTATELAKYRGGDQRGGAALAASLGRYGKARQDQLKFFASGVVSTDTLRTYLTSAHLKTTL